MSFANQALSVEYFEEQRNVAAGVKFAAEEGSEIASLKASTGISIDTLTAEQLEYISSWETGLNAIYKIRGSNHGCHVRTRERK